MKSNVLKVHPRDNVLVALKNLAKGETISSNGHDYILQDNVPAKHKFFVHDMNAGDAVIMYGVLVGKAQNFIPKGGLMSTANVKHAAEAYDYRGSHYHWQAPDVSKFVGRTFNGYHRKDGRVGTANYWLFIPTVFCENRNLDVIREALHNELGYEVTGKYKRYTHQLVETYKNGDNIQQVDSIPAPIEAVRRRLFKNVDGIKFLNHEGGCGGTRQDAAILSKLLAAYADHPNVGGITVLSLGCQNLQVPDFLNDLRLRNPKFDKPLYIFEKQKSQSEEQLITEAIRKTFLGLVEINKLERKTARLDQLVVGVKCGGSDGFSGISANPAVGYCADGLMTDAIKSAGAAKKGGTSPVVDVLDYTELATKPGLNLVCTPGNDVEATTGKAASGATLILFTTGLGTPTGNPVSPTIKVSTNSALTKRMGDIIDIDTGPIIDGDKTIEQMGEEILEYCIKAASGEVIPKAVQLNQDDFIPWKRGVSL